MPPHAKHTDRFRLIERFLSHCPKFTSAKLALKYNPLLEHEGQIRILTLHPGSIRDKIEISIHHELFTATSTPTYEALSYTWGPPENPKSIRVRQNGLKNLSVTRNLDVALKHLRHETETQELWIDAICIDQSNLKERGSQVQRMGEIYKRADRVVVWLGPEADDSTHAMDLLRSLASKLEIDWATKAVRPSLGFVRE